MLALVIGMCGCRSGYRGHAVWSIWPKTASPAFRIHWMWWPAIGGLIIGLGGLVQPRALGVGYDVIDALTHWSGGLSLIVGILIVKTAIWSLSLGSGTSGGVLAPVFMIGRRSGRFRRPCVSRCVSWLLGDPGLASVVGGVALPADRHRVHP